MATRLRALVQQREHLNSNPQAGSAELTPSDLAISERVPSLEHLVGQLQQLHSDGPMLILTFGHRHEVAAKVSPVDLALPFIDVVVGDVSVGDGDPCRRLAQEFLGDLAASSVADQVRDRGQGGREPEIRGLASLTPGRLVGVLDVRILPVFHRLSVEGGQPVAKPRLDVRDGAERYSEAKHVGHQLLRVTPRDPVAASQRRDDGGDARAQLALLNAVRKRRPSCVAAASAREGMELVLRYEDADRW